MAIAACGQAPDAAPTESASTAAGGSSESTSATTADGDVNKDFLACLVSDAGGWDDKSFNQSAYEGLNQAVADLGIKSNTAESTQTSDFAPNVDSMIQGGCGLTIGVGFLLAEPIAEAAKNNPETEFALIDSSFTDASGNAVTFDNARPLLFNTAEASYLAGYVAAGTTKTGAVATFGGLPIPSVQIFMDGFADGVAKYNEEFGKDVKLIGWDKAEQKGTFAGTFDEISQGQTITEGFISQGADIIMPVAGPLANGAATAAKAHEGTMVVWVDSDGNQSAPEHKDVILTSVLKKIDASVADTVALAAKGQFTNEPYVGTLENGGVSLAPFYDFDSQVPQEVKDGVKKLEEQIIKGDLKVESPNAPK
ncbi:BMP family lipoprotein [Stomatohabitans albus]|uniref:BMP family lipoprotein n=1 Tax=Stomatohabitans albus TaxID=3110766 RepID=UPI003AB944E9